MVPPQTKASSQIIELSILTIINTLQKKKASFFIYYSISSFQPTILIISEKQRQIFHFITL